MRGLESKYLFIFISIFIWSCDFAISKGVEIALIKVFKMNGDVLELEKNGTYAHSALKVKNGWMHAHPVRGVEIVSRFEDMGFPRFKVDIFISPNSKPIGQKFINKFLGLPYDNSYSWRNDKIYCSELIAKALDMEPTPMSFDSSIWSEDYTRRRGEFGLSPDDLVSRLVKKGFVVNSCLNVFRAQN